MLHSNLFFNGGVGDFLALEPYLTEEERSQVENVYLFTRKAVLLKPQAEALFLRAEVFCGKVPEHRWDYTTYRDFIDSGDASKYRLKHPMSDWSIRLRFREIASGKRPYVGSRHPDMSGPKTYHGHVAICPYSSDKRIAGRDFSREDWDRVIAWLEQHQMPAHVINNCDEFVPEHPLISDLSMTTTLDQAMYEVSCSNAYVGIDSCLSVVAARRLAPEHVAVRSLNQHLYTWAGVYYAPRTTFEFLGRDLEQLLARTAPAWIA